MFEMKNLCEKFFCFWRNWCKRPKESLVSIESSKLLENQKEAEHYSNITSSPQQIENTTFKEKKEIEMSTALPLEEDTNTIFPQKYMNNTETSPNFKSIFTREKMINFIEELINDKTTFTPLINKNGFDIYIRESGSIFFS